MRWTKEELAKLRKSLPSNWREQLAEQCNLKSGYIKNIIYGQVENDAVILAAVTLAKEHQAQIAKQKAQIERKIELAKETISQL